MDVGFTKQTPVEKLDKDGKPYIWLRLDPTLTPHQLRHAYATICYESGTDAKTTQSWLGHADLLTTQNTYTDIRAEKARLEVGRFSHYTTKRYGVKDTQVDTKAANR
jgi:integrase